MAKRDGRIDSVFADMNIRQHPGAALLVIDHDEIVYSKCYGLADLRTQRPITTDTSILFGLDLQAVHRHGDYDAGGAWQTELRRSSADLLPALSRMGFGNHPTPYAASHIGTAGLSPLL